ncbi:Nitrate/nitrite transporter [hydrothermal vent metagenome]|uniref:Nitrate/nitrite transporter n=1 Tax=hydrothermal vent metagenome TaxID=652676 RepID=A0A3B0RE37_9ZZZZ
MRLGLLFKVGNPDIKALHLTWIAFFLTFYVWFNMAPLATTMIREISWLTSKELKVFAICNVALTIPARLIVGMLLDKYGPRRVFSVLMVIMAIPTFTFAFGNTFTQLLVSRLILGSVGAGFVVGIHMTALWFKPKDIGFAEGFYAGWGNFGSAAAAITIPTIALSVFGGPNGWRYSIAFSGVLMLIYGVFYWFAITDGPKGTMLHKPKKVSAMEVSSYADMIKLIIFTIPCVGILSILVWKLGKLGFLGSTGQLIFYAIIVIVVLYQIVQVFLVNLPILRAGVPDDDKYNFNQVAALNTTYFCNFGAELAVVSMLPSFFEKTFTLTPAVAGMIAASFAFVNLFARPLGGVLSDMLKGRKRIMLIYMLGITLGFFGMSFITSSWPIALATALTVACSLFVQGAEGATFAIIPMIKRRITGQISGMAGSYGNVGAVFYLTLLTMVPANRFFFYIAIGALFSFLFCLFFLKEPQGSFGEEYHMSSVDKKLMEEEGGAGGGH